MTTLLNNNIRIRLTWSIASMLVLFAAALFISGMAAQSPSPTATPTPWPPKEQTDRIMVAKAVVQAMNESLNLTGAHPNLRNRLQFPSSARAEVQSRLTAISGGKLQLPREDEGIIVFFVPEAQPTPSPSAGGSRFPQNHYYSVFYLPAVEQTGSDPLKIFSDHLRCCYQPWATTAVPSPSPH